MISQPTVEDYIVLASSVHEGGTIYRFGLQEWSGIGNSVESFSDEDFPEKISEPGNGFYWPSHSPTWVNLDQSAIQRFAVVRDVDDTITLQRAAACEQDDLPDHDWRQLTDVLSKVPLDVWESSLRLGKARCFAGIMPSEQQADEYARETLQEAAKSRSLDVSSIGIQKTTLNSGMWLYGSSQIRDHFVFFYEREAEDDGRTSLFFNDFLPLILGFLFKNRRLFEEEYRHEFRSALMKHRDQLDAVISNFPFQDKDLRATETLINTIADALSKLSPKFGHFKLALNTAQLTLSKFNQIVSKYGYERGGLLEVWESELELTVDQMSADENYIQSTLKSAEMMMLSLSARANVERTQIEMRENVLRESTNRSLTNLSLAVGVSGLVIALTTDQLVTAGLFSLGWLETNETLPTFGKLLIGKTFFVLTAIPLFFITVKCGLRLFKVERD